MVHTQHVIHFPTWDLLLPLTQTSDRSHQLTTLNPLCSQNGGHSMEDLTATGGQGRVTAVSSGHPVITSSDLPLVPHIDTRHLESLDSSEVDLEDVIPRGSMYQVAGHQSAKQNPRSRQARGRNNTWLQSQLEGLVGNSLLTCHYTVLPVMC